MPFFTQDSPRRDGEPSPSRVPCGVPSLAAARPSGAGEGAASCAQKSLPRGMPSSPGSGEARGGPRRDFARAGLQSSPPASRRAGGKSVPNASSKRAGARCPSRDVHCAFIWRVGAARCWCLSRRRRAGDARTVLLAWTSPAPSARRRQATDVPTPPTASAVLGIFPFSLSPSLPTRRGLSVLPAAFSSERQPPVSCSLPSSPSRAGLGRREADEMRAPFGVENRENRLW